MRRPLAMTVLARAGGSGLALLDVDEFKSATVGGEWLFPVGGYGTGFVIRPNWMAVLTSLTVPRIQLNAGFLAAMVAVMGTTITPYLFFWQASQEIDHYLNYGAQSFWEALSYFPDVELRIGPDTYLDHIRKVKAATVQAVVPAPAGVLFVILVLWNSNNACHRGMVSLILPQKISSARRIDRPSWLFPSGTWASTWPFCRSGMRLKRQTCARGDRSTIWCIASSDTGISLTL